MNILKMQRNIIVLLFSAVPIVLAYNNFLIMEPSFGFSTYLGPLIFKGEKGYKKET